MIHYQYIYDYITTSNNANKAWSTTRISCHWQTHTKRCITANMLQTSNVNAGCDKLATELSWQCFVSVANFQLPAINKGYIAYFSMCMREPGLFLLLVWNLTSSSCTWTLISYKTREFQRFGHKLSLYCTLFNVHEQNCLISTSGLKSDVTLAFLDPNFYTMWEYRWFANI